MKASGFVTERNGLQGASDNPTASVVQTLQPFPQPANAVFFTLFHAEFPANLALYYK